jgi:glutamyl-tRNA synthetase
MCTFVINWAMAKQFGWEVVLRIEDIDGPRKKQGMIEETIDLLKWMGLHWDIETSIQSKQLAPSHSLLNELINTQSVYHCALSRKELEDCLSAPHLNLIENGPMYRPDDIAQHNANKPHSQTNWRFKSTESPMKINDEISGEHTFTEVTDFIVWTKDNMPSYQLAVVADDHRQGITDIVRGNDLLQSAGWQEQIYTTMNWRVPRWHHVPLVVGEDGKRLAKRHGDSRISTYRFRNVTKERIIGLIAMWTIPSYSRAPMELDDYVQEFDVNELPTGTFQFTKEDEAWLLD